MSKQAVKVFRKLLDGTSEFVREFSEQVHGEEFAALAKKFVEGREARGQKGFYVEGSTPKKEEETTDEDLGGVASYNDLKLADLKKECEAREIKLTGKEKKPELVALLEQNDEESGEGEEEE